MPTFGQLLLLGVGLEVWVGLATRDMVDDIFSPPEVEPGPPVCTHHPLSLSCSAHDISPVIVHAGDILMWNGAYEMEVVKGDSTDGNAEVTWALGAILPPTRPAPAWWLLHAEPAWKRAKESKKGTWTVTYPCECDYALSSTPYSREVCANFATLCCAFANASDSVKHADSQIWRGVRSNLASIVPFHFILRSNGTGGCPIPVRPRPHTPASVSSRPVTLMPLHSRAQAAT